MVAEKSQAFSEAWTAIAFESARQWQSIWWGKAPDPDAVLTAALKPLHGAATRNEARLKRRASR